jgi:PAS domain S-box-containing protein
MKKKKFKKTKQPTSATKDATTELQGSEEIYRTLIENISLGISLIDTNYRIIMTNIGVNRILKKDPNKVVGKYCFKEFEKRGAVCSHCPGTRAMVTGRHAEAETEGVGADGSRVPVRIHAFPIYEASGAVKGFIEVAIDVSERKRAEDVAKQSEEKYRSVVENIGIGVSVISPKMEILTMNRQMREWFSWVDVSKKPICYKSFNRPPRDGICSYCPTYKSLKDGQVHEAVTETPAGDKILNYRIISSPIKNEKGKVVAAIEMVEDITERRKIQQALKESREMYQTLFEGAAEGILVADIETKRFKYANPAICRMLGYTNEELKQLSVSDIHPKEELRYAISEFEAIVQGKKVLTESIPCLRKDGTVLYAEIIGGNILVDGTQCNVGFFTDITERKHAEEELLFNTALLEAQSETSIDGILVVDSKGKSLSFNKRYGQLWDIPQHILNTRDSEKMLQYVLSQLKEPDKFLERVKYLYAHKDEKSRDEIQFKDGKVFDRYSSPLRDSTGKHFGRIWYFRDITQHKHTEQELEKARDQLEMRVRQRTAELEKAIEKLRNEVSERKKAEEKLLSYQKQLRSSASELSLAEERLRRKIATDVHDHLGQNLAISKLKIESLTQSATSPQLVEELKEIRDLIAQTVESSRSLTFELSPPILYELGFGPAVEWLLRQTRQQHGLSTEFTDDKLPKPLDEDICVLLFQAVRELLVNVAKHAKASSVKVSTQRVNDQIQVSVEDDGIGFDVTLLYSQNRIGGGFGLFNIRERLDHIGGHLGIASRTGKGTRVTLLAPIAHKKEKSKEKRK